MLNKKVILVILDGCQYQVGVSQLGFLNHLVEHGYGQLVKVQAEMPSNSRPLYEVLMTGVPSFENGITTNGHVRLSKEESLFDVVRAAGGRSTAAAYYWYSELYNQVPYNIKTDRIQHNLEKKIQDGIFYSEDTYPDSHVFADAHSLITKVEPDFVVVHSMNIDDQGHKHGSDSAEYAAAVNQVDGILGYFIPAWIALGYQILVTADHGMDEFGLHGGNKPSQREVPLYLLGESAKALEIHDHPFPQLKIAPLICQLLGVPPTEKMQQWQG